MPDRPPGSEALEHRYRRLLRWFPPEHRSAHGEEMLGVLMAAARPGQEKPDRADTTDLIAAAARIRVRPTALSDGAGWRDALAVFSFAAPLLILASTSLSIAADLVWVPAYVTTLPLGPVVWVVLWGQALAVPCVLLGLRRWALVTAAIPGLFWLVVAGDTVVSPGHVTWVSVRWWQYPVIASVVEVVALWASPGPRRGRQLMRGRHWALLAAAAVPIAALSPTLSGLVPVRAGEALARALPWIPSAARLASASVCVVIIVILVLAMLAAAWLSSAAGKRLAVLFAVLAGPYLMAATDQVLGAGVAGTPMVVAAGAVEAIAACAVLTAVWRGRRRGPAPPPAA